MKMDAVQIQRTLNQFEAEAIPAEHPLVSQLERIFGEHTYFLDDRGLNIIEPVDEAEQKDGLVGVVINLANWTDASAAALRPHDPEPTNQLVSLESDMRH